MDPTLSVLTTIRKKVTKLPMSPSNLWLKFNDRQPEEIICAITDTILSKTAYLLPPPLSGLDNSNIKLQK